MLANVLHALPDVLLADLCSMRHVLKVVAFALPCVLCIMPLIVTSKVSLELPASREDAYFLYSSLQRQPEWSPWLKSVEVNAAVPPQNMQWDRFVWEIRRHAQFLEIAFVKLTFSSETREIGPALPGMGYVTSERYDENANYAGSFPVLEGEGSHFQEFPSTGS